MRGRKQRALEALSFEHHGVFTLAEARACGLTGDQAEWHLRSGEWVRLHPGVYRFASTPTTWHLQQMAAVKWADPAVASGRAAGFLHSLPGYGQPQPEVLTWTHRMLPRCDVLVHRTVWLPTEQRVRAQGVPATSVERTLLDLCGLVSRRAAAIALDHALNTGLATVASCDRCLWLTARRGRNGCGVFRSLVHERWALDEFPNSPLETVVLDMLVAAGLPTPVLQMEISDNAGRFVARPDFVYPERRLVIEAHSKLWHSSREVERADASKEERLRDLGYRVLYVTWADATRYAAGTVRRIEEMLGPEKSMGM